MTRIRSLVGFVWTGLKKRWKLVSIILLVIAGLIWWQLRQANGNGQELKFVKPEYKDLTQTLEVSGHIDAKEKARLRFIAGGKIVYVGAKEGDWVKKWQTIATIDRATLQKTLQKELNDYMKERWDWEETRDDIKDRAIETSERRSVDQEHWDLENTVLDVEIQDIAIKNTVLSAPFAGILTTSPTAIAGVQLLAADYFELINPETLVFRAEVDEADIALVKPNQKVEIILDAYPDDTYASSVNYISFTSSLSTSGTVFIVEIPIIASDLSYFRLGMNGDANIVLETRQNVMSIPLSATRKENEQTLVDIKTGEKTFAARQIEIGLETDDDVEVLSGLSEVDEVLLPE